MLDSLLDCRKKLPSQKLRFALEVTPSLLASIKRSPLCRSVLCSDKPSIRLERIWSVCNQRVVVANGGRIRNKSDGICVGKCLSRMCGQGRRATVEASMYTYTCRGTHPRLKTDRASESTAHFVCQNPVQKHESG